MKRILCFCLCLVLLFSCLPISAYAAAPTLSIDCRNTYSAGETFTVSILTNGFTDCCGIGFRLKYDAEKLTIVRAAQESTFTNGQMVENLYYTDDEAIFALTSSAAQDVSGTIITVTFTAKSDASGHIAFSIIDPTAVASDSSAIAVTASGTSIYIDPMPHALLTIMPEPGTDGNILLHVDLSDAAYYCALTFCLKYDNTRYQVVSATRGSTFNGAFGDVNKAYAEDAVFVSAVFAQASAQNGRLLTVELKPLSGAAPAAPFSLDIMEYADANFTSLDIDWRFSPTSVTDTTDTGTSISIESVLVNLSETQQTCTVMLALYTEDGQMLEVSTVTQTLSAGTAAEYALSVPNDNRGAYVKLFSLDSNYSPLSACISHTFSN